MKEQLVEFETAKLAKEKGFDSIYVSYAYTKNKELIRCGITNAWIDSDSNKFGYNYVSIAPTQSLLQKWLREEKFVYVEITVLTMNTEGDKFRLSIKPKMKEVLINQWYDSYEEALEEGLKQALKLI